MNKVRLLIMVASVLAVLNVVLLAVLFSTMAPIHPGRINDDSGDNEKIQKVFDFDQQQMEAFLNSKKQHGVQMHEVQRRLNKASEDYYLLDENEAKQKASLLDTIVDLTRQVYLLNDRHFEDIRRICRPEQLPHVDGLIIDLLRRPPEQRARPRALPPKRRNMD
ncbi:MAG: hypothetical protein KDC57_05655 [Saprospiraceae bacterium]|nr:hypothetical protein [Saprospiraceae bacterium]